MYTKVLLSVLYCTDDRVPSELKKAIVQARNDKKLTQSQLAQVQLSLFEIFLRCARLSTKF